MSDVSKYIIPFVMSNVVFGLALVAAVKRPMAARVFFVICFLGAAVFNFVTAIQNPQAYMSFADQTPVSAYRDFINGYFSNNIIVYVIAIAIGQLLVGLGLIFTKPWTRMACLGGMSFGLAIAPLGIGSAFPSTITLAISFYILYRRNGHDVIWRWNQYKVRSRAGYFRPVAWKNARQAD